MPVDVATAASAPSIAARRASKLRTVGLLVTRIGPIRNDGPRVRAVGKPLDDSDATGADGHHREAIFRQLRHLHHPCHNADVAARLATTDFAAAIDQHHPKLVVGRFDAIAHQRLIPRFKDVQGQGATRQQHTAQWEHRQRLHGDYRGPRSIAVGPLG